MSEKKAPNDYELNELLEACRDNNRQLHARVCYLEHSRSVIITLAILAISLIIGFFAIVIEVIV